MANFVRLTLTLTLKKNWERSFSDLDLTHKYSVKFFDTLKKLYIIVSCMHIYYREINHSWFCFWKITLFSLLFYSICYFQPIESKFNQNTLLRSLYFGLTLDNSYGQLIKRPTQKRRQKLATWLFLTLCYDNLKINPIHICPPHFLFFFFNIINWFR